MTEREALKLALEVLTNAYWPTQADLIPAHNIKECAEAITAIKEALAQPQQEPVVWMYQNKSTHEVRFQKHMRSFVDHSAWYEVPLYSEPLANQEKTSGSPKPAKPEALRLADAMEYDLDWCDEAAAELRRMHDLLGKANALCRIRAEEIERLKAQPEQKPVAWKLVPVEPTKEMLKAMDECSKEGYDERLYAGHAASVYMAAVDVAPTPPQPWEKFCDSNCVWTDHHPDCKLAEQEPVAWMDDYNACKCPDNEARCFSDKVFRMMQKHTDSLVKRQEPVAKVCHDLDGHIGWNPNLKQLPNEGTPLYTTPPQRKPLTDEEIKTRTDEQIEATFKMCGGRWNGDHWVIEDADLHPFVRAIEGPELNTLRAISDEYNAWIKHHAKGHTYDDFLAKRLAAHGIKGEA